MAILSGILNSLLVLTSLFLICLVLIQRGKGGGLAGAFGGVAPKAWQAAMRPCSIEVDARLGKPIASPAA